MSHKNLHIEIVAATNGLSSMGPKSAAAAQAVLALHYHDVRVSVVNDRAGLEAVIDRRPDLVFLGMKFLPVHPELGFNDPEKIWVSEVLEQHGIAHTGSDYRAHQLELNKQLAKQRVHDAGLQTARSAVIPFGDALGDVDLRYPLFVKPTNRGGGQGIDELSIVHNRTQLRAKVDLLQTSLQADALIEEYLPGREFSVAILKKATDDYALMPLELVAPLNAYGERFLSIKIKAADTEQHYEVTDEDLRIQLNLLAINVFRTLGARDYGRIDIRLDAAGRPHFLEANLLPSLLDNYGNFPKACLLNEQLPYEQVILRIVELGLNPAHNTYSQHTMQPHAVRRASEAEGLIAV